MPAKGDYWYKDISAKGPGQDREGQEALVLNPDNADSGWKRQIV